jgi:hypothetical protein
VQLIVNDRLVKRESRVGGVLLGITFALLAAGLIVSFRAEALTQQLDQWIPIAFTYAVVLVGMGLYSLGNVRLRRYGPQHRQDGRLRQLLKGMDDRYVLYAFIGHKLPDYILVGPSGLYVITPRAQNGEFTCNGDRWSRKSGAAGLLLGAFGGNPLGSPSYDTAKGIQRVRELLSQNLDAGGEEVGVNGLIVFTGSNVRLKTERCTYPATYGKELRKVIGKARGRLAPARILQLRQIFDRLLPGDPKA